MEAPTITEEELFSFHATHFSTTSTEHFALHFLGPVADEGAEDEDDGLGYYADGVKRTLTDEQIAIFRHSEIEALARERRNAPNGASAAAKPSTVDAVGEVAEETSTPGTDKLTPPAQTNGEGEKGKPKSKKDMKWEKAKQKGWFKQNIKPDLRKRTWDKVETGLGGLDYDETEARPIGPERPVQRKKVCYGDDY